MLPSTPGNECAPDRKSTRLNSSHLVISYAVFCLKKKTIVEPGRQQNSRRYRLLRGQLRSAGPTHTRQRAIRSPAVRLCFFFNDTAATEIYSLSLRAALPI